MNKLSKKKWVLYHLTQKFFSILFSSFGFCDIHGLKNIPKNGPFIIASNHASFLDPILLGTFLKRKPYFMAKKCLFNTKLKNWILNQLKAIPIIRHNHSFGSNISNFRKIISVLKKGEGIVIFPEGTRSNSNQMIIKKKVKSSLAMLSYKFKAPIIPTKIFGTNDIFNKTNLIPNLSRNISVFFSNPIDFNSLSIKNFSNIKKMFLYKKIMNKVILIINEIKNDDSNYVI
jgi:1-acyl-sn-glycerol-3-phosphate acyltransferase